MPGKGWSDVGADDVDGASGPVDEPEDRFEGLAVSAPRQREQVKSQSGEGPGRTLRASLPRTQQVPLKEAGDSRMLNADHQVVPREVVLREVEAADVGHAVVEEHKLLVVPAQESVTQETERPSEADPDPVGAEGGDQAPRFAQLGSEGAVEERARRVYPAVVLVDAGVRVDEKPAVRRPRAEQLVGKRGANPVPLEGVGLEVGVLPGRGQVGLQRLPEGLRVDEDRRPPPLRRRR